MSVDFEKSAATRMAICRSPRHTIGTRDHVSEISSDGLPVAKVVSADARNPSENTTKMPDNLTSLLVNLRQEFVQEVRSAQHVIMKQTLQLHVDFRREVEDLRTELRGLQELLMNEHAPSDKRASRTASRCPRCCREAVEGAVEALMEGVLCTVGDALHLGSNPQQSQDWQALADEIWERISVVNPTKSKHVSKAPVGGGAGACIVHRQVTSHLAELLPLQELLDSYAEAVGRDAARLQETAKPKDDCCVGGKLITLSERGTQQHEEVLPISAKPCTCTNSWILQESKLQRVTSSVVMSSTAAVVAQGFKENMSPWSPQREASKMALGKTMSSPVARPLSFLR